MIIIIFFNQVNAQVAVDVSDITAENITKLLTKFAREYIPLDFQTIKAIVLQIHLRPILFYPDQITSLLQANLQFSHVPGRLIGVLCQQAIASHTEFSIKQIILSLRALLQCGFEIPDDLIELWMVDITQQIKQCDSMDIANLFWILPKVKNDITFVSLLVKSAIRFHHEFTMKERVEILSSIVNTTVKRTDKTSNPKISPKLLDVLLNQFLDQALRESEEMNLSHSVGLIWACKQLLLPSIEQKLKLFQEKHIQWYLKTNNSQQFKDPI